MFVLVTIGVGMFTLTSSIKKDLNNSGCSIKLDNLPTILTWISLSQIVLPILYVIFTTYKPRPKTKTKLKAPKKKDEDDDNEESDESKTIKAESRRSATNKRRILRYKRIIAQKSDELATVKEKIELLRDKGKKVKIEDEAKEDILEKEIDTYKKNLDKIESPSTVIDNKPTTFSGFKI